MSSRSRVACSASDRVLERGFVRLGGPTLGAITDTPPSGVEIVETDGVILPGLVDLHGHPEYNVFAPWEPPTTYANRGVWRDSSEYETLVKKPYARFRAADLVPTLTRYAEIRALVGGVTAVQGASVNAQVLDEALVRNIDRRIFGQHRARSIIDLDSVRGDALQTLHADLAGNAIDAIYIHLAEGVDDVSRAEFELLKSKQLLVPQAVIIHGTALSTSRCRSWPAPAPSSSGRRSPTCVSTPPPPRSSGRASCASRSASAPTGCRAAASRRSTSCASPATSSRSRTPPTTPARSSAWSPGTPRRSRGCTGRVGDLQPGMPADVCVLERCHEDPWESVLRADPSAVQLVTIGGNLVYARTDWYDRLTEDPHGEHLWAWGRQMTLDTTYSVRTGTGTPPRLAELRKAILGADIAAGPIFA